ncbi:reverse transcriptase domain-containing protein [Tanacetum coccineum]
MPQDCLRIIESKSKVRNSRNKPVVAKVSSSASTPGISPDVAELKDMVKALLLDKKNQTQAPAPVKAVEERPTIPTTSSSPPKVVERETEVTKDTVPPTNNGSTKYVQSPVVQVQPHVLNSEPVVAPVSAPMPNLKPSILYPSRLNDQKIREKANNQIEKFYQIFQDLHFEISFADALILMPKFASTLKSLIGNKEKLSEMARTPLNEHCSVVLLKKLPEKLGDPGKFLIPCDFPGMDECLALADLGASINLMPLSVWKKLSLPELTPTCMTLELADRSITQPIGIAEDVDVKVGKFQFLADFVVVDFDADPRVPLILGRSFLKTGRALIDVYEGELTLRVGKEAVTFNLDQTSRYSSNYDDNSVNRIDVIEMACEEYSQEVLGFSDVIAIKETHRELQGKSVETQFNKPSVVRQPNAQRIPKPSVLGKPTPFSNSPEMRSFQTKQSVNKTNVSDGLFKQVTQQNLPQIRKQAVRNTNVIAPGPSRNCPKHVSHQSPREKVGSNDMVHNYYLEKAKKSAQLQKDKDVNGKPSMIDPARLPNTANGCKPKPRNWQASMSSRVSNKDVHLGEHRKQKPFLKFNDLQCPTCKKCLYSANHDECVLEYLSRLNPRASAQNKDAKSHKTTKRYMPVEKSSASKKPERQIPTGHRFSNKKTTTVPEKTMNPRSCLRWQLTGRILKTVGLRWVPTGKLFNSCTSKVESEPTHGSNVDIPHIHACKQTLGLSAGTSFNGQKQQRIDLNADALYNEKQENLRVWLLKLLISKKPVPEWPRSSMFKRRLIAADQASVFMEMTSVHISSGLVLHQMTSDHNRSELRIQDHSNEQSSSKLVPKVVP